MPVTRARARTVEVDRLSGVEVNLEVESDS